MFLPMTESLRIKFHKDGNVDITTDEESRNSDVFLLSVAVLVLLYLLLRKTQSSVKGEDGRVHLNYEFDISSFSILLEDLPLIKEDEVTVDYSCSLTSDFINTNEQKIDVLQSLDLSYDISISHSLVDIGECSIQPKDVVTSSLSFLTRLGELEDDDPIPPPDDSIWIVIPY